MYANRAHVNLLLGNNRRALEDAQQAIELYPPNIKVCNLLLFSLHLFLGLNVVLNVIMLDFIFLKNRLFIVLPKHHLLSIC